MKFCTLPIVGQAQKGELKGKVTQVTLPALNKRTNAAINFSTRQLTFETLRCEGSNVRQLYKVLKKHSVTHLDKTIVFHRTPVVSADCALQEMHLMIIIIIKSTCIARVTFKG